MELGGRVALVTGAASGIGRGISEDLVRRGMAVALLDLDARVVDIATSLRAGGGRATGIVVDVTSKASVDEAFEKAEAGLGPPWLLVNAAGILVHGAAIDMPEEDWDRVIAVDLKGLFLCSQAALRSMLPRGRGRIVNITSIVGRVARSGQIGYCVAKAGADHLTRCLAVEVAPFGVTVNAIAPGLTRSEMIDRVLRLGARESELLALIPDGRLAVPADHAAMVGWLASDEASHVTGQVICVDGGQSLRQPVTFASVVARAEAKGDTGSA